MLLRVDRVSDVLDFHLLSAWKYVVDKTPARSSARLSIVKLLIQSTFQVFPSVVDTGLKPCNQDYSQETLPGPGQTRIPCFAQAALTPEKIKFEKKSGVRLSAISCRCLQKTFSHLLAEISDRTPPLKTFATQANLES